MGFAHEYATAIMERGRVPMEPVDFTPNWADRPRKWKLYRGAGVLPLPVDDVVPDADPAGGTVEDALTRVGGNGRFSLPMLSNMLMDSYGLLGRRLAVQANTDLASLPSYSHANWFRGAASGGGLYPVSIYWVTGPSGPLDPGVYYYSVPHHGLQPLLAGNVAAEVRDSLGEQAAAGETDQFLVVGVKYWQNAFKYNSFSFHAVSMDVGAALQTWRMWAAANGLRVEPEFWFDEERVARLLGVSSGDEGIFAVIPLRWESSPPADATMHTTPGKRAADAVAVRRQDHERSRRVLKFPALDGMHVATAADAAAAPASAALAAAAARPAATDGERHPLPLPAPMTVGIRAALRTRRSSFGRFEAKHPISAAELSASLAAAAAAGAPLTKLYVFVNHVDGVAAGSYEYDPAQQSLRLIDTEPPGTFLQQNYFLANYNLEQAAVVIVPTIRTHDVLDAVGDRGYRLVNATIGAVAQAFYTAAAALDLGCGVALGFDNISFIEKLDLTGTGESPLLLMMIGNERRNPANFRYEIA